MEMVIINDWINQFQEVVEIEDEKGDSIFRIIVNGREVKSIEADEEKKQELRSHLNNGGIIPVEGVNFKVTPEEVRNVLTHHGSDLAIDLLYNDVATQKIADKYNEMDNDDPLTYKSLNVYVNEIIHKIEKTKKSINITHSIADMYRSMIVSAFETVVKYNDIDMYGDDTPLSDDDILDIAGCIPIFDQYFPHTVIAEVIKASLVENEGVWEIGYINLNKMISIVKTLNAIRLSI